ncbi:MAG: NUDIX domain-containing protein [Planctomycetota bacterium]
MSHTYHYPRPGLTVDVVVFGLDEDDLKLLLVRGGETPQRRWSLPGGFVRIDESLEAAARRELVDETGVSDIFIEQLYTFGRVDRDSRERVVTVSYYGLVNLSEHTVTAAESKDAAWFAIDDMPTLAFDHNEIVEVATARLRGKVRYQPIGFELLPQKFTLTQLQRMYEKILERSLDKRNFRKKALATGLLIELDEVEQDVAHRAARLYRFDERTYRQLAAEGTYFEV